LSTHFPGKLMQVPRRATGIDPVLVILPSVSVDAAEVTVNSETRILGLSLAERTVLAARRAGYAQVFFLKRDRPAEPGAKTIPGWTVLAEFLGSQPTALVIAPATILSETDWLKRLAAIPIDPATWSSLPNRIAGLGVSMMPAALEVLDADGGAYDIMAVQQRLAQSFGAAAAIPEKIGPMVVTTPMDIPIAERRLLQGLIKDSDGFMVRHLDRPVSLQISRRLASTAVTPTQITMLSIAIGLCGAPFFLSAHWAWQTLGALLFLLHSIVDGCDGELARLKFQESKFGGLLDFWGDNIVHVTIFGCIAAGWALASTETWPLWLGGAAIAGTLASAGFVHWKQGRSNASSGPLFTSLSTSRDHSLGRALDAMSSREFIYLTPVLTLLGKASWILILGSVGGPIFLLLLVVVAVSDAKRLSANDSLAR
jgi:1L-myo-inositol 1-phosphate cytidylyltransferase / CDP-L-myo-inositol myo-inositolphosphotransferase